MHMFTQFQLSLKKIEQNKSHCKVRDQIFSVFCGNHTGHGLEHCSV